MAKEKKPKRPSIWQNPTPYGTTHLRGDEDVWRSAFGEAMSGEEAEVILGDDSPWTILGIAPGSIFNIIKAAWRKLAMKWHPDRHQGEKAKKAAEVEFIKAKAAYVKLGG